MPEQDPLDEWRIDLNYKLPYGDPSEKEAVTELKRRLSEYFSGELDDLVDDRILQKYLRPKNFDVQQTFTMLKAIHKARTEEPETYLPEGKGPNDYRHVYSLNSAEVLQHRNPKDGSAVVIIRVGDWTPQSKVDYQQALNAGAFLCGMIFDDERIQRDGATLILDCRGLYLSWIMKFFPPSCIPSAVSSLQETSPVRFVGVHVLHQPTLYNVLYSLAWPFLSTENQAKINLHGKKLSGLHKFVDPRILPKDLQGDLDTNCEWIYEHLYANHDKFVKLSRLPKLKPKDEVKSL